ncbi:hypothetical protein AVEN_81477-1 [Araneus ventricosus]|uniref:Uncharacterized protein n=1 Tax=Araneus ventricosus TaxID=182803 RepID=A0A4Y2E0R6_ARAVE|nr:hypothetical protein AVEN_81477-1 [Araneus ventricosus]
MRDRCRLGGNVHGHSTSLSIRTDGESSLQLMKLGSIYLSDTNAKSNVQYLIRDQNRRDLTPSTTVPPPISIMIWMGISCQWCYQTTFCAAWGQNKF